jgi:hypothetical protein
VYTPVDDQDTLLLCSLLHGGAAVVMLPSSASSMSHPRAESLQTHYPKSLSNARCVSICADGSGRLVWSPGNGKSLAFGQLAPKGNVEYSSDIPISDCLGDLLPADYSFRCIDDCFWLMEDMVFIFFTVVELDDGHPSGESHFAKAAYRPSDGNAVLFLSIELGPPPDDSAFDSDTGRSWPSLCHCSHIPEWNLVMMCDSRVSEEAWVPVATLPEGQMPERLDGRAEEYPWLSDGISSDADYESDFLIGAAVDCAAASGLTIKPNNPSDPAIPASRLVLRLLSTGILEIVPIASYDTQVFPELQPQPAQPLRSKLPYSTSTDPETMDSRMLSQDSDAESERAAPSPSRENEQSSALHAGAAYKEKNSRAGASFGTQANFADTDSVASTKMAPQGIPEDEGRWQDGQDSDEKEENERNEREEETALLPSIKRIFMDDSSLAKIEQHVDDQLRAISKSLFRTEKALKDAKGDEGFIFEDEGFTENRLNVARNTTFSQLKPRMARLRGRASTLKQSVASCDSDWQRAGDKARRLDAELFPHTANEDSVGVSQVQQLKTEVQSRFDDVRKRIAELHRWYNESYYAPPEDHTSAKGKREKIRHIYTLVNTLDSWSESLDVRLKDLERRAAKTNPHGALASNRTPSIPSPRNGSTPSSPNDFYASIAHVASRDGSTQPALSSLTPLTESSYGDKPRERWKRTSERLHRMLGSKPLHTYSRAYEEKESTEKAQTSSVEKINVPISISSSKPDKRSPASKAESIAAQQTPPQVAKRQPKESSPASAPNLTKSSATMESAVPAFTASSQPKQQPSPASSVFQSEITADSEYSRSHEPASKAPAPHTSFEGFPSSMVDKSEEQAKKSEIESKGASNQASVQKATRPPMPSMSSLSLASHQPHPQQQQQQQQQQQRQSETQSEVASNQVSTQKATKPPMPSMSSLSLANHQPQPQQQQQHQPQQLEQSQPHQSQSTFSNSQPSQSFVASASQQSVLSVPQEGSSGSYFPSMSGTQRGSEFQVGGQQNQEQQSQQQQGHGRSSFFTDGQPQAGSSSSASSPFQISQTPQQQQETVFGGQQPDTTSPASTFQQGGFDTLAFGTQQQLSPTGQNGANVHIKASPQAAKSPFGGGGQVAGSTIGQQQPQQSSGFSSFSGASGFSGFAQGAPQGGGGFGAPGGGFAQMAHGAEAFGQQQQQQRQQSQNHSTWGHPRR